MQTKIKQLTELVNSQAQQQQVFYRHLLMVVSGALAVLGALSTQPQPDSLLARYLLIGTWLFLGLSVLLGVGATYMAVSTANRLKLAFHSQLAQQVIEGDYHAAMKIVSVKPNAFFVLCSVAFVCSWLLAVVLLVSYSVVNLL